MADVGHPEGADPAVSGAAQLRVRSLPSGQRRRVVAATLVRSFGYVAVLLVAYSLIPIRGPWDAGAYVRAAVVVVVAAAVIAYQIVAVSRARYPAMRAVEAVALVVPLTLVLAASAHLAISSADPAAFSEELDHVDALYFALTTLTTIGYGDISPVSDLARVVVMVEMVVNVALLGMALRLIFGMVQHRLVTARAHPDDADPTR